MAVHQVREPSAGAAIDFPAPIQHLLIPPCAIHRRARSDRTAHRREGVIQPQLPQLGGWRPAAVAVQRRIVARRARCRLIRGGQELAGCGGRDPGHSQGRSMRVRECCAPEGFSTQLPRFHPEFWTAVAPEPRSAAPANGATSAPGEAPQASCAGSATQPARAVPQQQRPESNSRIAGATGRSTRAAPERPRCVHRSEEGGERRAARRPPPPSTSDLSLKPASEPG